MYSQINTWMQESPLKNILTIYLGRVLIIVTYIFKIVIVLFKIRKKLTVNLYPEMLYLWRVSKLKCYFVFENIQVNINYRLKLDRNSGSGGWVVAVTHMQVHVCIP